MAVVLARSVTEKSWFPKKKKEIQREGAGREPPRTNRRSLQAHALCSVNFEMADCTSRSPGDSSKSTTCQLYDHNHMPTARAALAASTLRCLHRDECRDQKRHRRSITPVYAAGRPRSAPTPALGAPSQAAQQHGRLLVRSGRGGAGGANSSSACADSSRCIVQHRRSWVFTVYE